jgi:hypothetical protein
MCPGKPPKQWNVAHFANIGASEEFIQQLMLEMLELVDAGTIFEPRRQEVKNAIATISMEGLMPAFERLKRIRSSITEQMALLNRKQLYEDFSRVLWHDGYKDLLPRATLLMGVDIGFLFQKDANFENGLIEFQKAHPSAAPELAEHLRAQRINWQNNLADCRNHFLEHRKEEPEKFTDFYVPSYAEALFDAVWRTIADILVVLLALNLPPRVGLVEIPISERSGPLFRRFRFVIG